ncbi:hypothetical protein [Streptomyces sp. NRRL S-813]|uniref:hypothetical protein n=1 Tax=Streptomyces sp. NRRL S-813 TaxID=1463919 RepID=UPI00068B9A5E|nr:hypothetical protein [Streptomyces sp. NRRL S-813]
MKKLSNEIPATSTASAAPSMLSRRAALTGAAAVTLAAVGGSAVAAAADAPRPTGGANPPLDASHATREVTDLVVKMFQAKAAGDVDGFMSYFSKPRMTYTDAIIGGQWRNWDELYAVLAPMMPEWGPTARAYPTKVIGDSRSAMFLFCNSPELFGHEIRTMAPLDFRDGKIIRQVDYWDGRHFGVQAIEDLRRPAEEYPHEFSEGVVGENASPVVRGVAAALSEAFVSGNAAAAADLFTLDASFEDLTLRSRFVGRQAIAGFLERGLRLLPYGPGSSLRHAVGSAQGGGYEWYNPTNPGGPLVNNGAIALELDRNARITGLTALWDGALISDAVMTTLLAATIER